MIECTHPWGARNRELEEDTTESRSSGAVTFDCLRSLHFPGQLPCPLRHASRVARET